MDLGRLTTMTKSQALIGMVQYYRDMWPSRYHILAPLIEATDGPKGMNITCAPVSEIPWMVHIKISAEKFLVFLGLAGLSLAWFEETLKKDLVIFKDLATWIHDGFMWMVNLLFHAMYQCKECWFCWSINVSTQWHGMILKVIVYFNSNIHENSYPVVELYYMCLFKFFYFFSNEWCMNEKIFFELCINFKEWFLKIDVLFFLCSPILLNDVLYDMVFLMSSDDIFTPYDGDIRELDFDTSL